MRILTAFTGRTVRPTTAGPRQAHAALDRQAYRTYAELNHPMSGLVRAGLLSQLAALHEQMGRLRPEAFGPSPIADEGGRDMAEADLHAATLLDLLADVEYAATINGPRTITDTWLEAHAGPVLTRMAATRDPVARGRMLDNLYDAVVDVVGPHAAEVINAVPMPGHERPVTLLQHLATLPWQGLARELLWVLIVVSTAVVTAAVVFPPPAPQFGPPDEMAAVITILAAAAAGVGATLLPILRPLRLPTIPALLWSTALGLIIADMWHDIGPKSAVTAVSLTLAVGGTLLARLRHR
ncbi:hypothetical protein [Micromonospora aurantiaca (nom. illeg.)]|uniref:hypothetical protein n=1 Tax=Micromonospora aurantiaca (nom. illeg.) TaxID=47850 RepID=UPI0011A31D90|nr:hypothetical protein [Micromonospora aurantiaca]MBC9000545.1 hypothetical protein [Micromonospora aurantiaca]